MNQKYLSLIVVVIGGMLWTTSCADKPQVKLEVDKTNVNVGDTITAMVEGENIINLVVNMGDSTQYVFTQNLSNARTINHAYDSTGLYLLEAYGISDDDAESESEAITVE